MNKPTKWLFLLIIVQQTSIAWSGDSSFSDGTGQDPPKVNELEASQRSNSTATSINGIGGANNPSGLPEQNATLVNAAAEKTPNSSRSTITESVPQGQVTPATDVEIPVTGSVPQPMETTTPISEQPIGESLNGQKDLKLASQSSNTTSSITHEPVLSSSATGASESKNIITSTSNVGNETVSVSNSNSSRNDVHNVNLYDMPIAATTSAPARDVNANELQKPKPLEQLPKAHESSNVNLTQPVTEKPPSVIQTSNGNASLDKKISETAEEVIVNNSKALDGRLIPIRSPADEGTQDDASHNYFSANAKNHTSYDEANRNKSTLIDLPGVQQTSTDYVAPTTNSSSISKDHSISPPATSTSPSLEDVDPQSQQPHHQVPSSTEQTFKIPEQPTSKVSKTEDSSSTPTDYGKRENKTGYKDNSLSTRDIPSPSVEPTKEIETVSSTSQSPPSTVVTTKNITNIEEDEETTTPNPTIHQFFVDLKTHTVMCLITLFILLAAFAFVFFFFVAIILGLKYVIIGLFKLCKKTMRCMKRKKGSNANEGVRDSGSLFGGVCVRPYVPGERQLNERDMY